jgi:hypothetical protein
MANEYTWVKKSTLDRLDGIASNQPQVRMSQSITSPRFYFSGSGRHAKMCLDIPKKQAGEAGGTSTFPCKVVSKSGAFYNVEKYENGIDGVTTGTAKLFVLSVPLGETVPAGTWVMASESAMGITGGGYVP